MTPKSAHHPQVSQLQSQLSSQRTLAAAQKLLMALALLALGTNWGPAALWTLAAAAFAGLIMLLLGWGADEAPAHVTAHEQLLQQQKQQRQAGQSAAAATAAAAAAAAAAGAKGGEAGALHVLATASEGSECAPAPAPMAAATEELLVSRVFGSKTIDETVGSRLLQHVGVWGTSSWGGTWLGPRKQQGWQGGTGAGLQVLIVWL